MDQKTEMRLDPLTLNWTVLSAARTTHPSLPGAAAAAREANGASPFSVATAGAHSLYSGPVVRVIPNRVPALRVEGDPAMRADGFYDRMDGVGAHEVIIEGNGTAGLDTLPLPEIAAVITAWKVRMLDLMRDQRMRGFVIVKSVGTAAGASIPDSVSQLIATALVPSALKAKLQVAREFYRRKGRSIFEDVWLEEVRVGSRLVYENNGFGIFCPYASRTPFELAIYPKRQCADFHGVTDQEIAQLADALKTALCKLNVALDHPAYNLTLFTAPVRTARKDHWNTLDLDFRWHIEIFPRLYHTGGFELGTGFHLNPVWPEDAAAFLRKIEA